MLLFEPPYVIKMSTKLELTMFLKNWTKNKISSTSNRPQASSKGSLATTKTGNWWKTKYNSKKTKKKKDNAFKVWRTPAKSTIN